MIVLFSSREVQIRRKSSLAADEHLPLAGAALECEPVQDAALGQHLQQERQHDFLLRDHDVAKAGFNRVTLHLWLRQHS